jgi:BlaI family transcriptional regulator, penicillinase repressor
VADVRAKLEDRLAYTTVLTILRTLEGKGYVANEEEGRAASLFRRRQATCRTGKRAAASHQ